MFGSSKPARRRYPAPASPEVQRSFPVIPSFTNGLDEHPPADVSVGMKLQQEVIYRPTQVRTISDLYDLFDFDRGD